MEEIRIDMRKQTPEERAQGVRDAQLCFKLNHTMVHLPLAAQPFIALCMCIRLMWHDTSGVESMMEKPVHLPRAQV